MKTILVLVPGDGRKYTSSCRAGNIDIYIYGKLTSSGVYPRHDDICGKGLRWQQSTVRFLPGKNRRCLMLNVPLAGEKTFD